MAEEEAARAFLELQVDGRVSGAAAVSWVAGHPRFAALSRPAREGVVRSRTATTAAPSTTTVRDLCEGAGRRRDRERRVDARRRRPRRD